MILGFFFVRPVPLPEEKPNREDYDQRNSSYTPLLDYDPHINGQDDNDDDARIGVELSETSRGSLSRGETLAFDMLPNIHGKKLWCSSDFWLLFGILSIRMFACSIQFLFMSNILLLCSQRDRCDVYVFSKKHSLASFDDHFIDINNVGSMSQCLYAYNNPNYDDVVGSGWQTAQVSTISIMNFLGRIFIGINYSKSFFACTQSVQAWYLTLRRTSMACHARIALY